MYVLRRATGTVCRRRTGHPPIPFVTWSRRVHNIRPLPFDIDDGLGDFLSPIALKIVAEEYQQGLLNRLNEQVVGTELETLSVAQTVISTGNSIRDVLAFNYASQALNNSFFFDNLLPPGQSPPLPTSSSTADSEIPTSHEHTISAHLLALINSSFGSLSYLKSSMSAAALGMMSSGWVWLVCDENASHLAVVATYGPGTMLVRSRQHRHPEGLSPSYGIRPGGMNSSAGRPFKVLGETMDSPSDLARARSAESAGGGAFEVLSRKPLRPGPVVAPGARTFHHASQALSPFSAAALQQLNPTQANARSSQLPLAWRTPLEPLSTANRYPRVPHALRHSSTFSLGGEKEAIEDLLTPIEELDSEPEERPLRANGRPAYDSHIINNAMHARANVPWDANRWRGSGDDLSPLMCISVHEHMWMAGGGYGIWGKEEYLRRLWDVVNWHKVSRVLDLWTPNSVLGTGTTSFPRAKGNL